MRSKFAGREEWIKSFSTIFSFNNIFWDFLGSRAAFMLQFCCSITFLAALSIYQSLNELFCLISIEIRSISNIILLKFTQMQLSNWIFAFMVKLTITLEICNISIIGFLFKNYWKASVGCLRVCPEFRNQIYFFGFSHCQSMKVTSILGKFEFHDASRKLVPFQKDVFTITSTTLKFLLYFFMKNIKSIWQ